jgi:hypothetical protein
MLLDIYEIQTDYIRKVKDQRIQKIAFIHILNCLVPFAIPGRILDLTVLSRRCCDHWEMNGSKLQLIPC